MAFQYTVGIAGSTGHTRICAEALRTSGPFEISWVLTPPPQLIGRKQVLTKNPLHLWAEEHGFVVHFVEKKLRPELETQLAQKPDFLLVVDFGYLVPPWLLQFPRIAPLNVHPSLLPRWRGSSPGQFVLLHGEAESAVTIMVMGEGLDTGPLLWQGQFTVDPTWTQIEYYQHSFQLAAKELPKVMQHLATGELKPQPQPENTPTPIAKRFTKQDGFVDWKTLAVAMQMQQPDHSVLTSQHPSQLLKDVQSSTQKSWAQTIQNAVRGLSPWPGVWTLLPTTRGMKRLKILSVHIQEEKLLLDSVQLEGELPSTWNEVQKVYLP